MSEDESSQDIREFQIYRALALKRLGKGVRKDFTCVCCEKELPVVEQPSTPADFTCSKECAVICKEKWGVTTDEDFFEMIAFEKYEQDAENTLSICEKSDEFSVCVICDAAIGRTYCPTHVSQFTCSTKCEAKAKKKYGCKSVGEFVFAGFNKESVSWMNAKTGAMISLEKHGDAFFLAYGNELEALDNWADAFASAIWVVEDMNRG